MYYPLGLILVMLIINATNNAKKSFLKIRNNILRVYLRNCEKQKIRNISKFYHNIISKIYDAQLFYYKLTDDEKDILDTIWSLCY